MHLVEKEQPEIFPFISFLEVLGFPTGITEAVDEKPDSPKPRGRRKPRHPIYGQMTFHLLHTPRLSEIVSPRRLAIATQPHKEENQIVSGDGIG
jgi:hypothetical protein